MGAAVWFKCDCGAETFICSKTTEYECYECRRVHMVLVITEKTGFKYVAGRHGCREVDSPQEEELLQEIVRV